MKQELKIDMRVYLRSYRACTESPLVCPCKLIKLHTLPSPWVYVPSAHWNNERLRSLQLNSYKPVRSINTFCNLCLYMWKWQWEPPAYARIQRAGNWGMKETGLQGAGGND